LSPLEIIFKRFDENELDSATILEEQDGSDQRITVDSLGA